MAGVRVLTGWWIAMKLGKWADPRVWSAMGWSKESSGEPLGQFVAVVVHLLSCVLLFATQWTPGFCALHYLPELAQTDVHWVSDAIHHLILCRPLLLPPSIFPSIRVFSNESALPTRWPKYWNSASASVLPMSIQGWSPLGWTSWISLQSKGLSRVFSNTTIQKHHFFSAQPSLWSNSHICPCLLEKP